MFLIYLPCLQFQVMFSVLMFLNFAILIFIAVCLITFAGHMSKILYSQNKKSSAKWKSTRHIPDTPERILDAPDITNDYCKFSATSTRIQILLKTHKKDLLPQKKCFKKYPHPHENAVIFEIRYKSIKNKQTRSHRPECML